VISARPKALHLVVCLLASSSLLAVSGTVCAAGDVKAGRAKALMCQACHGIDGLSKVPDAPNIAA
jgi:cytochrome c553